MSRRRSNDPAIPVSIAIPRSLHTRLAELMSYKQSRSAWVCDAIKAKLAAHSVRHQVLSDMSNQVLLQELLMRKAIDDYTYNLLIVKLPVEETATEQ